MSSPPLATPTITLSTLARAMGPISPSALTRLLQGHKHRKAGPSRSYQCARKQAIDLLTDARPLDANAPLRKHERDAVKAMQRIGLRIPRWSRALRANRTPHWELEGVRISMHPDVELDGFTTSGAAKIVFTKEPLARGVGSAMAALLFHHRRHVLDIRTTERDHCIVYEPRLPWLHLPTRRPEAQVKNAELACKVIAALWEAV